MLPHFIFIHAFKEIKVLFCPFLFLNTATFLKNGVFLCNQCEFSASFSTWVKLLIYGSNYCISTITLKCQPNDIIIF